MKFSISQPALRSAVETAKIIAERKASIPILANVMIQARDGIVTIAGTDLDTELRIEVPATVAVDGAATVSAGTLRNIAAACAGDITISAGDDGFLVVTSGKARYRLGTLDHNYWPQFKESKRLKSFNVPAKALCGAIATVRHAMSSDEIRFYLNGILFHTRKASRLGLAATNGHWLASVGLPLPDGAGGLNDMIVQRRAVKLLMAAMAGLEGDIAVSVGNLQVSFRWPGGRLATKCIDGKFPDYDGLIPKTGDTTVTFDTAALRSAIANVCAMFRSRDSAIRLAFKGDHAILSTQDGADNSVSEIVPAVIDGQLSEIAFNPQYLDKILESSAGERARFILTDGLSPARIEIEGFNDRLFVLMPRI